MFSFKCIASSSTLGWKISRLMENVNNSKIMRLWFMNVSTLSSSPIVPPDERVITYVRSMSGGGDDGGGGGVCGTSPGSAGGYFGGEGGGGDGLVTLAKIEPILTVKLPQDATSPNFKRYVSGQYLISLQGNLL